MSYEPVNLDELRDRLLTVSDAKNRTAITEGLNEYSFETDKPEISFNYPDGWVTAMGGPKVDGMTLTEVTASLDSGPTFALTKDAALEAASLFGLQKSYTLSTPGPMITDHVNYWYSNSNKKLKLLAGTNGVAFTRDSIKPFSNHELIDAVVEGIQSQYHTDDIVVDYKFHHDLKDTSVRFIVPSVSRFITSARHSAQVPDQWAAGISLHNSVIGSGSLELSGYLFSYWCANGMTTTHVTSGKYRRKPTAEPSEAYEWATEVVNEVLGGLEHELDRVQELTQIRLDGELNETLGRIFTQVGVPTSLRENVINNLVESDDLSAYGLANSITAAANDADVSSANIESLLRAGGEVVNSMASMCPTCRKF